MSKTANTPLDIDKTLNEYPLEHLTPIATIFMEAIASHDWPQCYRLERYLPNKKKQEPITEDDKLTASVQNSKKSCLFIKLIWPYTLSIKIWNK